MLSQTDDSAVSSSRLAPHPPLSALLTTSQAWPFPPLSFSFSVEFILLAAAGAASAYVIATRALWSDDEAIGKSIRPKCLLPTAAAVQLLRRRAAKQCHKYATLLKINRLGQQAPHLALTQNTPNAIIMLPMANKRYENAAMQ